MRATWDHREDVVRRLRQARHPQVWCGARELAPPEVRPPWQFLLHPCAQHPQGGVRRKPRRLSRDGQH